MKESELSKEIRLQLPPSVHLYRNNTGTAYNGKVTRIGPQDSGFAKIYKTVAGVRREFGVSLNPGDVIIKFAQMIRFGLKKGSADWIGYDEIEITPDMVGKKIARFYSLEVKTKNVKMTPEQTEWKNQINAAGGVALEVRE